MRYFGKYLISFGSIFYKQLIIIAIESLHMHMIKITQQEFINYQIIDHLMYYIQFNLIDIPMIAAGFLY